MKGHSGDDEAAQAKGGKARAAALSPERRAEISRNAALARWDGDLPIATNEGDFKLGDAEVSSAVLKNGQRIITQATFLRALGRSRSPKAGTGVLATVDGTPFFLQAEVLKPFISEDLMMSTTPVFYKTLGGRRGVGYDARLLPQVAEVYLKFRDGEIARKNGSVPARYRQMIAAADVLMRALATVGIIALVDEATGYQEVRDRHALQAILDRFLQKELAAWAKRFPDEFYKEMFRLKRWPTNPIHVKRPGVVGKYTTNIVYERLAPGIVEELEKRNPKDDKGNRKGRHHQLLTDDVGHPALAQHLYAVIGLMRASNDWDAFLRLLDRAYPRRHETLQLGFDGSISD